MNEENNRLFELNLILPLSLLILEIIVIIVLVASGYEITQFLLFFFILLGAFLILQVGRQLMAKWRINQAITKIKEGQALVEAGQHLQAIKLWKSMLFSLPQEHFFDVLKRIESAYEEKNMNEAIQQVQAIQAESKDFFEMTRNLRKGTPQDRRNWQTRAFELQNMIKALPEEPGQDLSDTKPE